VGLVFFHSAVIFGPGEFPVKADTEHLSATVFLAFGATWGMPLLFVISGMGVWYSLRSRTATAFVGERLRRLGVPLLVGLLTLVPLQVWLGLRRAGDPGAAGGFYARFWDVRPALDFPFVLKPAPDGLFETGHLWFLVCLLGFSWPSYQVWRGWVGREGGGWWSGWPGRWLGPAVSCCRRCRSRSSRSRSAARSVTVAGTTPATRCSSPAAS
jgi:hypothetical protein